MDCIFCKIIAGEIPSAKVFEDENVLAFLDVKPEAKGHTLVIPKKHAENIFDIDEDSLKQVFSACQPLARKLKSAMKADGISLRQSNGAAAGQLIMHLHVHLIPRFDSDGLMMHGEHHVNGQQPSFEELQELAKRINS